MKFVLTFLALVVFTLPALAQHEYAPLQEHEFKYKDWTYKSLGGEDINLRRFAAGKKLVLVVYFAAWCHNWKYQAPAVQKFYEKYKANGLDVIAVAEYETVELTQKHYQEKKFTFPVVFESTELSARLNTPHYDYRKKTGDTRKWGSPWNLFLETANLRPDGDTLLKKAFVANGELVEADVEKFIREKLGLPAVESKAVSSAEKKEIEACEPAKDFKKPPR